jgi:hypothetical protein
VRLAAIRRADAVTAGATRERDPAATRAASGIRTSGAYHGRGCAKLPSIAARASRPLPPGRGGRGAQKAAIDDHRGAGLR